MKNQDIFGFSLWLRVALSWPMIVEGDGLQFKTHGYVSETIAFFTLLAQKGSGQSRVLILDCSCRLKGLGLGISLL